MNSGPILPVWFTVPIAGATILILAAHVLYLLHARGIDPRRRRIRIANGLLMLLATPLIAYGFSIATPSASAGGFVLVWTAIPVLLLMVILLGLLDALHTVALHRREHKHLRRRFAQRRAEAAGVSPRPDHAGPADGPNHQA